MTPDGKLIMADYELELFGDKDYRLLDHEKTTMGMQYINMRKLSFL
jgi:hypothetical protein